MATKVRIMRSGRRSITIHRRLRGTRTLLGMLGNYLAAPRKIAMENAKIDRLQKQREIDEMELAIKSNKVVLLDMEIERQRILLEKLKQNNPHLVTPEGVL